MSTEAPKSGQRRRRRRKKSSGDRAAAAVATVEILPGMIPDEDTLAEGIENLEAALKKKKQPERPVLAALQALSSRDLIEQAKALSIDGANTMPRAKLVFELMRAAAGKDRFAKVSGILDIMPDGHGFCAPSRTRSCLRRMMCTSRPRSSKNWNFDGGRKSKGGPLHQPKTNKVGSACFRSSKSTVLRQKPPWNCRFLRTWCRCTPTAELCWKPSPMCSRREWSTLSHRWGSGSVL